MCGECYLKADGAGPSERSGTQLATAGEIAARFEHKWPTTTRHLRVLEEAGLLNQEKRGRTRVYTLDRKRLALLTEWLEWFTPK